MATSSSTLDELRRRIDEIDDRLHDLVMQRAEIVETIAGAKKRDGVGTLRPGREALILRRLVGRHRGRFPRAALVRLWRELIGGTVAMQGQVSLAVYAPETGQGYWDLARDHYGGSTPLIAFRSVGEVLRALAENRAAAGVLPMPAEGERAPWWPLLALSGASAPRVMVRLPFAGRGNARGEGDAIVIGHGEADPTGADRSFVALEIEGEVSRARLIAALRSAGLAVTLSALHEAAGEAAWHLVEIDDHVPAGDPRLQEALAQLGEPVGRVAHLGGYARPFAPAELGDREAK